jgi:hypothetical protein
MLERREGFGVEVGVVRDVQRVGCWICVGVGRGRRDVGLASWEAVSGGRVDGAGGEWRVSSLDDDEVNHFGFEDEFGCLTGLLEALLHWKSRS